jgi:RNA 2',3'-cyclic 3'-phosphodiesterase
VNDANIDRADARVFFALVPDRALQKQLGALATEFATRIGGRATRDENIHLTLAFIGSVRQAEIATLRAILDALPRRGFELTLDHAGTWNHAEIAWLGARDVPKALDDLHSALSAALVEAGYPIDDRPFRPHLTLARRGRRSLRRESHAALAWRVGGVSLMRSESTAGGVRYRELARIDFDQ